MGISFIHSILFVISTTKETQMDLCLHMKVNYKLKQREQMP